MLSLPLWVLLWSARLVQLPKSLVEYSKTQKCAVVKVPFFIFFLRYGFCSNSSNLKTVQILTVILAQNWCLPQCGALQLLRIFIASNLPWSVKLFTALPAYCPLCRTPFLTVSCRNGSEFNYVNLDNAPSVSESECDSAWLILEYAHRSGGVGRCFWSGGLACSMVCAKRKCAGEAQTG